MTAPDAGPPPHRRGGVAVWTAAALFVVYALTVAPDVTFWDAGEFLASVHSLGIPHPPGTPIFILLENVWTKLLVVLPFALAGNLFSAAVTAAAGGLSARLVQRATGRGVMAFAAGVAAGGMSSVWLNATEAEVYAASLLLAVLMLWAGERAGATGKPGWVALTAYVMALAVPLHLSALVVAPAAIFLAAFADGRLRWPIAAALGGVFLLSMGAGQMSATLMGAGAVIVIVALTLRRRDDAWRLGSVLPAASVFGAAILALSALAFLYLRARLDPAINQGDPRTLHAFADAVARRQYDVSPMWPRSAPAWIQLGNLAQYADWQVALSLGPTVLPSVLRTAFTVLFLFLGYRGAVVLWRANRRFGIAMAVLFACGSLGVLAYLNLHAGPSIGYGILAPSVLREARERDYFFVFAFWAWGMWAGIGAVDAMQRWQRPAWTGALVALLPVALNWRAVTRRGEPEQSLPRAVAESFLESAPANAVLFVVGDNDSYPLWFAQQALGIRRDVTVVTIPLLPTEWYRAELRRRDSLFTASEVGQFRGSLEAAVQAAAGARRHGRPVAAAITLRPDERQRLGKSWTASGLAYVEGPAGIDTVAMRRWADWVSRRVPSRDIRPSIDPVNDYFRRLLDCPRQLAEYAVTADSSRLDSVCNYR